MNWFTGLFNWKRDVIKSGFLPWRFLGASPQFNEYGKDIEKLQAVLRNPAVLKVFTLQCDLFSLGKIYVYKDTGKKKGQQIEDDPVIDRFNKPNYMQGRNQFLWDFMFWKMLGNAYLYMDSFDSDRENAPWYWLEPHKIDWPLSFEKLKDKLVLSKGRLKEIDETIITYSYDDGTDFKFPYKKIASIHDLTNGTGNWFKGFSRIDALYKIISNSDEALNSKNINIRYAGKFLVSGQQDPSDVTKMPMSGDEKKSIEDKVDGDKQVHAIKSMIDIKRFVDDLRVMPLDEAFLADYYFIGAMYNIPRDILEAHLKGSTYENQEKSMGRHVSYTLEPAGEQLGDAIAEKTGHTDRGRKIVLSWDHLPFNQVFEKDRAAVQSTKALILNTLLRAGVKLEEINIFLDTEFTELTPPEPAKKPAA